MRKLLLLCAVSLLLVFPVVANATSISVLEPHWSGSRSTLTDDGVTATDGWSGIGNNGFEISWVISQDSDTSMYSYQYNISGQLFGDTDPLGKGLSHWILEVTDGSKASDFLNVSPYFSTNDDGSEESPKQWVTSNLTNPNPYMPSTGIYGLKWETTGEDVLTFTVSFDTMKDPVWGDFYAKDGFENASGVFATAYNAGFGIDLTATNTDNFTDFTNWIARPNGGTWPHQSIPEPATMLLLGSGLIGIAVSGKKRFKRRNG